FIPFPTPRSPMKLMSYFFGTLVFGLRALSGRLTSSLSSAHSWPSTCRWAELILARPSRIAVFGSADCAWTVIGINVNHARRRTTRAGLRIDDLKPGYSDVWDMTGTEASDSSLYLNLECARSRHRCPGP